MAVITNSFEALIKALGRLPGVGRRSAERMAMKLIEDKDKLLVDLIETLDDARRNLVCCARCGMITNVKRDPCRICTDPGRDSGILCVVEQPGEIALIDGSGAYHGRYHALMGKISVARGIGPDDIRVSQLVARVTKEGVKEVVIALNTDVESDATASFLTEILGKKVKVSRLAYGLPVGSSVMYSDPVTLARAVKGRQQL